MKVDLKIKFKSSSRCSCCLLFSSLLLLLLLFFLCMVRSSTVAVVAVADAWDQDDQDQLVLKCLVARFVGFFKGGKIHLKNCYLFCFCLFVLCKTRNLTVKIIIAIVAWRIDWHVGARPWGVAGVTGESVEARELNYILYKVKVTNLPEVLSEATGLLQSLSKHLVFANVIVRDGTTSKLHCLLKVGTCNLRHWIVLVHLWNIFKR